MVYMVYLHCEIQHKSHYNVRFGPGKVSEKSLVLIHQNLWEPCLLWNCPLINVTGAYWWWVKIGSGDGLVPSGNKPFPEPMLTQISGAIWRHWLQWHNNDNNNNNNNKTTTIIIMISQAHLLHASRRTLPWKYKNLVKNKTKKQQQQQ